MIGLLKIMKDFILKIMNLLAERREKQAARAGKTTRDANANGSLLFFILKKERFQTSFDHRKRCTSCS